MKKSQSELNDLITQSEAAKLRGVSLPAINELISRGRLHSREMFGRTLVYRSEVMNFERLPPGWPKGKARKKAVKKRTKKGKNK